MPSEMGTSSSSREQVGYQQSPKRIPPVHDGSQLIIFGLFKDKVPHSATLTAKSPDGELTLRVEVYLIEEFAKLFKGGYISP